MMCTEPGEWDMLLSDENVVLGLLETLPDDLGKTFLPILDERPDHFLESTRCLLEVLALEVEFLEDLTDGAVDAGPVSSVLPRHEGGVHLRVAPLVVDPVVQLLVTESGVCDRLLEEVSRLLLRHLSCSPR